jgi:hypothetical protein
VLKCWFQSCLVNGIEFVEIPKICSNNTLHRYSSLYIEATYGVAHGSLLGPIWFLLYINDLPGYVQCAKLVLYADEVWLFDSELVLNTAKICAFFFFHILTLHTDIISSIYSPTDALVSCLKKNNIKIYNKIYISQSTAKQCNIH